MKRIANYLIAMAVMAFTFTSCEDVPSPFGTVVPPASGGEDVVTVDPAGSGTEADPYNVAAALQIATAMSGDDAAKEIVAKGYIVSIDDMSTSYGNCTYNISDDADGKSNKLMVYRGYGLNGEKFTTGTEIKEGDLVVIKGGIVNFKGNTPEFTTGSSILSINGAGGGTGGGGETPSGTLGTKDAPLTIAKALETINALADGATTDQDAYVKGKVVKVNTTADNFAQYGNLNYYISEDGTDNNTLYVYAGDGLDGAKFGSVNDLKAGDEVIVFGKLQKYVNKSGVMTPEVAKGNYLVSLTSGGGSTTPDTPTGDAKGSGTQSDPYNVAAITEIAGKLATGETSTQDYYFKGKISTVKYTFDAAHGTATFFVSDNGTTSGEFQVYSAYYLENKSWVDGNTQIKVGDEVVIFGKLTNYNGTLETASKKAYIYSLNGKTQEGGSTGGGGEGGQTTGNVTKTVSGTTLTLVNNGVTASSSTVTVDLNAQGWENAAEVTTVKASDGTTITFSVGEGSTTPKYYSATKGVRLYAKNTVAITGASKAIAKVVLTCDAYNGTDYVGNETLYGSASGNTLTIVNEHSSGSGGVQLRVQTIEITYAN